MSNYEDELLALIDPSDLPLAEELIRAIKLQASIDTIRDLQAK